MWNYWKKRKPYIRQKKHRGNDMCKKQVCYMLSLAIIFLILNAVGCGCKHNWEDATCTTPKKCTVCDETEGTELGHRWQEATCTESKLCTVCQMSEGEPLGHSEGEKCSRCGYVDTNLAIEKAKKTIHIYGIDLDMDSAGGVDTYITWENVSQKEIKYIVFSVQYYNRVKDVVKDEIDGATMKRLEQTGPIPYGKGNYEVYAYSNVYDTAESLYFTVAEYKNDKENGWDKIYYFRTRGNFSNCGKWKTSECLVNR